MLSLNKTKKKPTFNDVCFSTSLHWFKQLLWCISLSFPTQMSLFRCSIGVQVSRVSSAPGLIDSLRLYWHFLSSPQLAQGQDGSFRRFAVLEFATAEMAEEAQRLSDVRLLGGTHIRVSFCAPGPPGRSMLAALIAAQTMVYKSPWDCIHMSKVNHSVCHRNVTAKMSVFCLPSSRRWTGVKVSSLIPQPCRYSQALITLPPSRCCSTLCHMGTNKVSCHKLLIHVSFWESLLAMWFLMLSLCAGLLGAAPTMPLLANPALSAALLQLLLQNQAKAQQVLLPFCLFLWHVPC